MKKIRLCAGKPHGLFGMIVESIYGWRPIYDMTNILLCYFADFVLVNPMAFWGTMMDAMEGYGNTYSGYKYRSDYVDDYEDYAGSARGGDKVGVSLFLRLHRFYIAFC